MDPNRASHRELDQLLDQFDDAWNQGTLPNLAEFLEQAHTVDRRELLIELIKIDQEYRWRAQPDPEATRLADIPWFPLLRDYQRCFAELGDDGDLPLDLIAEEYRVRSRWGDQPSQRIYTTQFGSARPQLASTLAEVDRELRQLESPSDSATGHASLIRDLQLPIKLESSPADLQIGDEIDDFRLLSHLGSGSFAEVFLAQQKSMQRLVALKISQVRTHEPKVLSSLDHPNIVRVFDQRQVGKLYLLLMQYVAGGSLREIVDRMGKDVASYSGQTFLEATSQTLADKGELPTLAQPNVVVSKRDWPTTVTWLAARLTSALQHAHQQGVLHRDIKPENILVTADGLPLLVDFNLSFGQTVEGANARDFFGGSLAYMSPQQLEVLLGQRSPQDVDEASDFYSLAIVLWELLVGERPFPEEPEGEKSQTALKNMLARRRTGPSLSELPRRCPGGLKEMLAEHLHATDSDYISSTTGTVRRLHLALTPGIDRLLTPSSTRWEAHWIRWPTTWLLICGLVPNGLISLLNIWANHRLTLQNFDIEFFRSTQQPVINAVMFSLGIIIGLWLFAPVIKAMWAQQSGFFDRLPDWDQIGKRSLTAPGKLAFVIIALWLISGVAFPWWNQSSPNSRVGSLDFFVFISSQLLHGLIAAATTYVLLLLKTVRALFPRFLPEHEDRAGQQQLDRIERQLDWAVACLGLIPLLAILVMAFTNQVDKHVFVALAIVGFLSHLMTWFVTPNIRRTLRWLKRGLSSTEKLVQVESLED